MMKLFLLFVAVFLVPVALSYGIDPAAILPKSMNYHGRRHRPDPHPPGAHGTLSRHDHLLHHRRLHAGVAARGSIWAVFFLYSLAAGRILSLIVDGMPSPILLFYMAVELIGGTLGLLVLARERRKLEARQ